MLCFIEYYTRKSLGESETDRKGEMSRWEGWLFGSRAGRTKLRYSNNSIILGSGAKIRGWIPSAFACESISSIDCPTECFYHSRHWVNEGNVTPTETTPTFPNHVLVETTTTRGWARKERAGSLGLAGGYWEWSWGNESPGQEEQMQRPLCKQLSTCGHSQWTGQRQGSRPCVRNTE